MSDTFCPPIDVVEDAAISLLSMYLVFWAQPAVLLFFGRFLSLSQKVKMSEWTTSTIDKTKQTEPLGFKIAGHYKCENVESCQISDLRLPTPPPGENSYTSLVKGCFFRTFWCLQFFPLGFCWSPPAKIKPSRIPTVDWSEIRNNHLGYINLVNNGIHYQPQLVSLPDFWTINHMDVTSFAWYRGTALDLVIRFPTKSLKKLDDSVETKTYGLFEGQYSQGSLYYQPKQCTFKGKSPKSTIHLHCLIPPKWGNLMIPEIHLLFQDISGNTRPTSTNLREKSGKISARWFSGHHFFLAPKNKPPIKLTGRSRAPFFGGEGFKSSTAKGAHHTFFSQTPNENFYKVGPGCSHKWS